MQAEAAEPKCCLQEQYGVSPGWWQAALSIRAAAAAVEADQGIHTDQVVRVEREQHAPM